MQTRLNLPTTLSQCYTNPLQVANYRVSKLYMYKLIHLINYQLATASLKIIYM